MQKMADEFEAAVGGIVKAAVAGDFTQRVDLEGKTGLVLNVGTAINSLCENVAKALDDLMKMLNALAEGELTQRITAEYQGNFATLKDNANTTAERIGATIAEHQGRRRARSPTPRPKSPPAPPTCRSAPRSRPRAWKRPPPRWSRSPRP